MDNSIVLGADIGGSHITVALVNLHTRAVVPHSIVRAPVNSHGTADEIINAWCAAIQQAMDLGETINKVGIAMPNPVDYESGISYIKGIDKYDSLYGLNIKELVSARLGIAVADIRMKNDAGCFLQGEVFGGAAKDIKHAIGLTIGTGIGTAHCHDGVAEDADLWHTAFKDSMVEDYISSRWFVKRYAQLSGSAVKNVKELSALYDTDKNAQAVFTEFAHNLAQFLTFFVRRDNPEVIVIGGNIANASALFFPLVETLLAEQSINIPIHKAILGEEAAVIGAASTWHVRKPFSMMML